MLIVEMDGFCLQVQKLVEEWVEDQVLQIEENKCVPSIMSSCVFGLLLH